MTDTRRTRVPDADRAQLIEPPASASRTDQHDTGRRGRPVGSRLAGIHHVVWAGSCLALRTDPWTRGRRLAMLTLLLGLCLLLHAQIPNGIGHLGSLVETFLPWSALLVPIVLARALQRRSALAVTVLLLPVGAWLNLFGGSLADKSHPGHDIVVVEHNVGADNSDPTHTARALSASGAEVLALVELSDQARRTYETNLATVYPFHAIQGTVGVWSKLPLSGTRRVDIGMDYGPLADTAPADQNSIRALRTTVITHRGPLAVYVAHLASVRMSPPAGFDTAQRDRGIQALDNALASEPIKPLVLLGDLNGTTGDRAFTELTSRLQSTQDMAGSGLGFTWPALFPVARIDQILVRDLHPHSSWVLPATGSDHLPIAAGLSW